MFQAALYMGHNGHFAAAVRLMAIVLRCDGHYRMRKEIMDFLLINNLHRYMTSAEGRAVIDHIHALMNGSSK